jgi:hypothetical protein
MSRASPEHSGWTAGLQGTGDQATTTEKQKHRNNHSRMLTKNLTRLQPRAGLINKPHGGNLRSNLALNRLHQQQIQSIHIENSVGNVSYASPFLSKKRTTVPIHPCFPGTHILLLSLAGVACQKTLPFKFRGPETSKTGLAVKIASFFFVGFFTPFAIARYQM